MRGDQPRVQNRCRSKCLPLFRGVGRRQRACADGIVDQVTEKIQGSMARGRGSAAGAGLDVAVGRCCRVVHKIDISTEIPAMAGMARCRALMGNAEGSVVLGLGVPNPSCPHLKPTA